MASEKLKELMNQGIASEIQATIQYMWQHVQWMGVDHYSVSEQFKEIAIQEMKHAEKIAERLWYLEGVPTTKPAPINVGVELWEMIGYDVQAEVEAITLYKQIIELAAEEGDVTTKFIFEQILEEEEEHHDFFTSLEQGKPKKK